MKNSLPIRLLQFLAALCLLSVIPAKADQFGDFTYTATATEVTITGYTGTGGAITIPSAIGGLPVTSIGLVVFQNRPTLTSVTIPNSVTSLGGSAFSFCTGLTSLTIGNSVTSIGDNAFATCIGLTSVTIGSGVTSIGIGAFYNCTGLTSVTIPNSVTSIGNEAFYECSGLTSVTIGSGVTSIGDIAFAACTGLTSVTIGSGVTSIGRGMFQGCIRLTSLTIPNSVTSIAKEAFYQCSGLTSVTIGSGVTSIEDNAFAVCTGLTSVYFQGNAPTVSSSAFTNTYLTIYYYPGKAGWGTTYAGRPTVQMGAIISSQPVSVTALQGTSASFTVTAGSGTSYQWQKNSVNIPLATTATLSLGNVQTADAAAYTVTVTNATGSVTSDVATLTVIIPPAISIQPVSTTVNQAASASFSVTATGTTPTYQWKKNGADLAGATSATLNLTNVQTSNAGSYTVLVTNAAGSVLSSVTTLTVIVPLSITVQPVSVTANLGASASFSVTATGTSPTYQWKKAGVNITGATIATLSFGTLLATDSGSYTVTATNAAGTLTSSTVTLTVISPPTISTQPVSISPNLGASASLSVTATGGAPYTYQWQKGGADVTGATAATLSFATLSSTDAGSYTVVVINAAGTVTSNAAILTVVVTPTIAVQPVSINVNQGASATFSVTAAGGGTNTYQWKKAGVNIVGATTATLSLSNVQSADAVAYSVTVTNAMGNVTSNAAMLTVIVPPVIIDQPTNIIANPGEAAVFSVVATGSPSTYQWKRNGVTLAGATEADLNFSVVQPVHVGSYRVVVSNAAGSVTSSTVSLTLTQGALYTQSQYDSALQVGLNAGMAVGMATGRAQVTDFPNNYGLYSLSQVQALHVGTPLLAKDSATGKFKLTIGVEKSTNLVNFSPMAIPVGSATINAEGKMEFQFTSPDNAAFYRLESR